MPPRFAVRYPDPHDSFGPWLSKLISSGDRFPAHQSARAPLAERSRRSRGGQGYGPVFRPRVAHDVLALYAAVVAAPAVAVDTGSVPAAATELRPHGTVANRRRDDYLARRSRRTTAVRRAAMLSARTGLVSVSDLNPRTAGHDTAVRSRVLSSRRLRPTRCPCPGTDRPRLSRRS